MARVHVEDSALVMAKRLAGRMGWEEDLALGRLIRFWHDTQAIEQEACEAGELAVYFKVPVTETRILTEALIVATVTEPIEDGRYRIRGNAGHIQNLRSYRERGSKGGKETQEKARKQAVAQAPATPPALAPAQAPTVQFSAVQCSADQCNEIPRAREGAALADHSGSGTAGGEKASRSAINGAVDEWGTTLKHFGITRDPRLDASEIGRLIQQYTAERVRRALAGFRAEKPSKSYDPAAYLSFNRLRKDFQRFEIAGERVISGGGASGPHELTKDQILAAIGGKEKS